MNEIEQCGKTELAQSRPSQLSATEYLIETAFAKGTDPAKLFDLLERERSDRRKMDFDAAFQRFQLECPPIEPDSEGRFRRKIVDARGRAKSVTQHTASKNRVMETLMPIAAKHGLALSWPDQTYEPETKCVVSVAEVSGYGYSKKSTPLRWPLSPIVGGQSGRENSINDQINAALTFANKATMLSLTGARIAGEDYEAGAHGQQDAEPVPLIGPDEIDELNDAIIAKVEAVNAARRAKGDPPVTVDYVRSKLHATYGVASDAAINIDQYREAMTRLREGKQ